MRINAAVDCFVAICIGVTTLDVLLCEVQVNFCVHGVESKAIAIVNQEAA